MGDTTFTITKKGEGRKLSSISYDGKPIEGYFIKHDDLKKGKELVITTRE
jgi:putative alpha-1,2-mannosidase